MRILWIGPAPWCYSGYGVVAANVIPRLQAMGHDIGVLAVYGHKGSTMNWQGIPIYPDEAGDYGNLIGKHWYDHHKADLIITMFDVWACRNWRELNCRWWPYVPIDHSPTPPMVRQRFEWCDRVIAMSRFGQEEVKKEGFEALYVPHGVDTNIYQPMPEAREGIRRTQGWDGKFVIGTVATNISTRKNFDFMLQTFAEFHRRHPDSEFFCYTNPRDKQGTPLEVQCRLLGIGDAVRFPDGETIINGLPPTHMAALYNSFDAFMLLSKGEGFGIPIIEAQACGVPVVVTDWTAMSELAGPGFKVPLMAKEFTNQGSYWGLARIEDAVFSLEKLYREWKRGDKTRSEKSREFAMGYDWDTVVNTYWKAALDDMERKVQGQPSMEPFDVPYEPIAEES